MRDQVRPGPRARRVLGIAAVALAVSGTFAAESVVSETAREVAGDLDGRRIASRVRFLASDFMEGREAGTRGERLAAEYIRDFYMGLGVSPAGTEGFYYQYFDLHERTLGDGNAFVVVRRGEGGSGLRTSYPLDDGFLPFNFSPSAEVEAPVVFAGYGITAPEHGYDDYDGIDVSGAVVLVLRHEPGEADPDSPFNGLRPSKHAAFLTKVRLAQARGAVGLLLVTDPLNHTDDARDPGNRLARWSSLVEREEHDRRPPPDPRQFYPEIAPDVRIPAAHISPAAAADLLAGQDEDLRTIQEAIDSGMKPASRRLPGVLAALTTDVVVERVPVKNVVARIEGSDPVLREEYVVLGGHYDHVGYDAWGRIHPGADDNASGTACLMSIAEAVAASPVKPKRSLLFVHFTAEEKGLMGSRWFVEHPTVPLDKMVAMINMDMVGRNEPRVLSIVLGDSAAAGLDALLKRIGPAELDLELNNDAGTGIDRSDQRAFSPKGIPAVAFFSGTHDDYHKPADTAGRIVEDKLRNVARLATMAAWEIAEQGPALIRVEKEESP
jgi:hypothetical protein